MPVLPCAPSSDRELLNPYAAERDLAAALAPFDAEEALQDALSELDRHLASPEALATRDVSVYSGLAGIALTLLRVADGCKSADEAARMLQKSQWLCEACLGRINLDAAVPLDTFLCGDLGVVAVAAAVAQRRGDKERCSRLVEHVVAALRNPPLHRQSDELLYGRAGWLQLAHFISTYLPEHRVPDDMLRPIIDVMFARGRREAADERSFGSPLLYTWHGKAYLGVAHGLSGIVLALLWRPELLSPEQKDDIRGALAALRRICHRDGNLPSSLPKRRRDELVQYCHGAPGHVLTLCRAYEVFGDESYLQQAQHALGTVWHRGVLRKYVGLCHSVAGNAYSFLHMYRVNGDDAHLHRARAFAALAARRHELLDDDLMELSDRPWSLFEGLCGAICLFADLAGPSSSRAVFPGH